jgi:hypothetical protein
VAGDWHSAQATVSDFIVRGWPVLMLWGITVLLDIVSKPTPQRPVPNPFLYGVLPCLLLVGSGVADLAMQGSWK